MKFLNWFLGLFGDIKPIIPPARKPHTRNQCEIDDDDEYPEYGVGALQDKTSGLPSINQVLAGIYSKQREHELRKAGFIIDEGQPRFTETGKTARKVMELTYKIAAKRIAKEKRKHKKTK